MSKKFLRLTALILVATQLVSCSQQQTTKLPHQKTKLPQVNEIVVLKSPYSSETVFVSNNFASWLEKDLVVRVKKGTTAKILEIKKETIEYGDKPYYTLVRFRVKTTSKPIVEGWVFSADAGFQTTDPPSG